VFGGCSSFIGWIETNLVNGCNFDTSRYNLGFHLLAAIFVHLGLSTTDLALIYLAKQRHHVLMQHGREQLRIQGRMAKSFLELITLVICPFGMNLRCGDFIFCRGEVIENGNVGTVDVDLVEEDDQNGRNGREPLEGSELILEANG